ncbi:MAG TPA: hypothetical protein VFK11_05020 [Candidatus Saccharimonadales bacterium]|nr:hypothetical protein [Candidatus Saccharimonadales bacterium]
MIYAYLVFVVLVALFSIVILFGAPYLPTLGPQRKAALDLLDLKEGQVLFEPGCGDGRVLAEAARRGITAVGVELNPLMALVAFIVTFRYRKNVKIIWGNFWTKQWPEADGVFLFLMDRFMDRFDNKMRETQKKPTKVASFAYKIAKKKPLREKNGVFLYRYE